MLGWTCLTKVGAHFPKAIAIDMDETTHIFEVTLWAVTNAALCKAKAIYRLLKY